MLINNGFVTDFEAKANHFNTFFAKQCKTLTNSSNLPEQIIFQTNNSLSSFEINSDEILQLICGPDENKAHGYDGISIRMLILCDESIVRPLKLIFEKCLLNGIFAHPWKKGSTVPIHKKVDKHIISNYRPVSLLPICGKIFKRIMYNSRRDMAILDHLPSNCT